MSSRKATPNVATSQSTPRSSSAATVADSKDILGKIFFRLPTKSLVRFKTVSKYWLSLISDPNFCLHRRPRADPISGLFLELYTVPYAYTPEFDFVNLDKISSNSSNKGPFQSLPFTRDSVDYLGIVQSCNGLLLCQARPVTYNSKPKEYFVFNPTTSQYTALSLPFPTQGFKAHHNVSLAFDPSISPDKYQVVGIRRSVDRSLCQVEIYSSQTRCWRLSGKPFREESWNCVFSVSGVFCNGDVHWINPTSGSSCYFDLDEECIKPMPPVPDVRKSSRFTYYGESRGHLHLVHGKFDQDNPNFKVYELKVDYSDWFPKFFINVSDILTAFPEAFLKELGCCRCHRRRCCCNLVSILCVIRGEVEEESYALLQIPGKILQYNFKTESFCKIFDNILKRVQPRAPYELEKLPQIEYSTTWDKAYQYVATLASV